MAHISFPVVVVAGAERRHDELDLLTRLHMEAVILVEFSDLLIRQEDVLDDVRLIHELWKLFLDLLWEQCCLCYGHEKHSANNLEHSGNIYL